MGSLLPSAGHDEATVAMSLNFSIRQRLQFGVLG